MRSSCGVLPRRRELLHGPSCRAAFEGERDGIRYELVSADRIGFAPKLIEEFPEAEKE